MGNRDSTGSPTPRVAPLSEWERIPRGSPALRAGTDAPLDEHTTPRVERLPIQPAPVPATGRAWCVRTEQVVRRTGLSFSQPDATAGVQRECVKPFLNNLFEGGSLEVGGRPSNNDTRLAQNKPLHERAPALRAGVPCVIGLAERRSLQYSIYISMRYLVPCKSPLGPVWSLAHRCAPDTPQRRPPFGRAEGLRRTS
jgi:hypothetical protein